MKRCPTCGSRKWREWKGQGKCFRCGKIWRDPSYHKTTFSKGFHIGNEKHQNPTKSDEQNIKDNSQLLSVDFHDNIYKFKIKKDNPAVSIGIKKKLKNWTMEIFKRGEVTYRRTTQHIVISIEKRFIEEIRKAEELKKKEFNITKIFKAYAEQFQEDFNIILDLKKPIPVTKEVKPIEAFRSPVQFYGDKVKCVYPNGDIEWIGKDAVDNFKNFVENISLETKADSLLKTMDGGFNTLAYLLTQQNEILQKVLNKQSFFEKIRRFFKWEI